MNSKQIRLLATVGIALLLSAIAVAGNPTLKPDQVNTAGWDGAWTNLVNDAEQSFVPSLPKLTAVEVELVVGNPGPPKDELMLTVFDSSGQEVAAVSQLVPASNSGQTLFVLSAEGVDVKPGETYRMRLTGGLLFGWKYIVRGYRNGAATFNGKPLLPKERSTFLFRTFGAE